MNQFYSRSTSKCYGCVFSSITPCLLLTSTHRTLQASHLEEPQDEVWCSSHRPTTGHTINNTQGQVHLHLNIPLPVQRPPAPMDGNTVGKEHWTSSVIRSPQDLVHCRKATRMLVECLKNKSWNYFPHDHTIISLRLHLYVIAHITLFHFSKSAQCLLILYAQKVIFDWLLNWNISAVRSCDFFFLK